MGSEPDISKMRRTSLEAGTHWAGCENDHIECYIMHLRARLAACEEREQSLKRKLGANRRIAPTIPDGYEPIEAWTNGTEIVVLGAPPEEGTPEADEHNCDAMGCSAFGPHVIHRAALKEPSRG